MKNVGFYNGRWEPLEKLFVPALDRAFYFGDGIYDAAYTKNKIIFAENEHVTRFFRGLEKIGIRLPYTQEEVTALLRLGVGLCDEDDLFVYFQASCGTSVRCHADREGKGNLLIMIYPKKIAPKEKTLRVCTVSDTRYALCDVKTLNLMPNVLAAQEAEGMGCDEAIFVRDGEVTECAHSNVHILTGGILLSPPPCYRTLDGIGRRHLISACEKLSVPVVERRFSPEEMKGADEIIVTSAGYPCQRVVECDKAPCGQKGGRLFDAISDVVYREIEEKTRK